MKVHSQVPMLYLPYNHYTAIDTPSGLFNLTILTCPRHIMMCFSQAKLGKINERMRKEYTLRRQMLLKRLDVTVQSFQWSDRVKVRSNMTDSPIHYPAYAH